MRILLTHHRTPEDADSEAEVLRLVDGLPHAGHEVQSLVAEGPTFSDLTDQQIAQYRQTTRRAMDDLVAAFDPQVIHCQHAWLDGHLALETGAPYVLTVWGPELDACRDDPRYRRFVEEAAANAGRLLVSSESLRRRLSGDLGDAAGRIVVMPPCGSAAAWIESVVGIYRAVVSQRFGPGTWDAP